jgi:GTPase SAR1 family protein
LFFNLFGWEGYALSRAIFAILFFCCLTFETLFLHNGLLVSRSFAQVPKVATPSPPPNWQGIDVAKLDAGMCERIKTQSPSACLDGDPGIACRFAKTAVTLTCQAIGGWSIFDYLPSGTKEKFIDYASAIIVAVISLLATSLIGWIKAHQNAAEVKKSNETVLKLEDRVLDPFFQRPDDYEQYGTNLILIGEGGSGKTTLLHALSASSEAAPDIATAQVSTYTLVYEVSIKKDNVREKRRLVRIYAEDYEGQNWVQGTQKNELLKKRQDMIRSSTLLIVVDLVSPASKIERPPPREGIDKRRVRDQLEAYNDQSIQTLTHLIDFAEKRQIVLFINKIDLIYPVTRETIAEAKKAYSTLIDRLEDVRGAELHVLVGSAATGQAVVGYDEGHKTQTSLLKFVIDHALRIDAAKMRAAIDATNSPTKSSG